MMSSFIFIQHIRIYKMKSILDKMGITPNAMQQDAMHALLRSDKDVVVL